MNTCEGNGMYNAKAQEERGNTHRIGLCCSLAPNQSESTA